MNLAAVIKRAAYGILIYCGLTIPPLSAETITDCELLFTPEDPRLFDFVESRRLVDYEELEGRLIEDISVVVLPVFNENDPSENNWIFRGVNYLHINTRAGTVTQQLTFKPQRGLVASDITESERILRENSYLTDAMIVPQFVCEDRVTLLAVVRDTWSLSPSISFSRSGGSNKGSVGISDSNILGSGQSASIGYRSTKDRDSVTISYRNNHVLGSNVRLRTGYADNSDGHLASLSLEQPFYTLDSNWSAGFSVLDEKRIEAVESGAQTLNQFQQKINNYNAFLGWSPGIVNGFTRRVTFGINDERDRFSEVVPGSPPPPEDRRLVYPNVTYQSIENRFVTLTNIDRLFRNEDIPLGRRWGIRVGYADESIGSTMNTLLASSNIGYALMMGTKNLVQSGIYANAQWEVDTEDLRSTTYGVNLTYHRLIDDRNRWLVSSSFDAGKRLGLDEEFVLGGEEGMRGYPDDFQRGNRRLLLSIERRHFLDYHFLQLVRLGGAVFVDVGRAWSTEISHEGNESTLANAGFGLRLNPSKARSNVIVHMDIAFPMLERELVDSYQIILSGRSRF